MRTSNKSVTADSIAGLIVAKKVVRKLDVIQTILMRYTNGLMMFESQARLFSNFMYIKENHVHLDFTSL